jgi:MFS family permease
VPDAPYPDSANNNETPGATNGVEVIEADRNAPPREVVRRGGTFESFRHRDFTWFWAGALVSNTGTWMQMTALGIVVWTLRESKFDLGIVNFVSGIPVLFLAIPGGLVADRLDKRKLLIWSQALAGVLAAVLWVLFKAGRLSSAHALEALWWIASIGLLGGVMSALTFPAWQAFLPDLVPRRDLMNAIALNSAQFQSSRLLGPLAAGWVLLIGLQTGDVFLVNAASFLFVIAALFAIRPAARGAHETGGQRRSEGAWHTITAGLRYAKENPVIGTLIWSTAMMTLLGMPYMTLLPAIADEVLHGPNHGQLYYAYLVAANGLGALVGSLLIASLPPDTDRERIIPPALVLMAGSLIAFSISRSLVLSLAISGLAGATFLSINSLANTSIQSMVPHELRGRVMSLFIMSFMGIMPISAVIFGALGEWLGTANAVMAGAVLLLAWGLYLQVSRRLHPEG